MTDKQIIEQRPICLYQDTCLYLKEKTRVCEDCVHHKNYWSELLAKDQAEKIKNLEQECEELKKIINEAKNSKLDLKSFLVGEAIQNEYEQQLDQLKAENNELKNAYTRLNSLYNDNCNFTGKLEQTITEIKEIAEICKCYNADGCYECKYFDDCEVEDEEIPTRDVCKLILQKITECEGNNE